MQKRSAGKKELRPGRSSRKETMGRGLQPVTKGRSAGERPRPGIATALRGRRREAGGLDAAMRPTGSAVMKISSDCSSVRPLY